MNMTPTKTTIKRIITMAAGTSVSTVLDKSHYTRMFIIMPAGWDIADMRFFVSDSLNGVFRKLEWGSSGNEVTIFAQESVTIGLNGSTGEALAASPFVKIRSITKGLSTPKNQTANRKFIIILSRW